ncbi:hypothetical protein GCM10009639_01670 [Kitasatospora putterlickiae]|uniref:Uncharacterized protein n=1 Tax=Kitasatospora putterlickiae TaxID=221725 RepID=A0ABN1XID0_9ACTN
MAAGSTVTVEPVEQVPSVEQQDMGSSVGSVSFGGTRWGYPLAVIPLYPWGVCHATPPAAPDHP